MGYYNGMGILRGPTRQLMPSRRAAYAWNILLSYAYAANIDSLRGSTRPYCIDSPTRTLRKPTPCNKMLRDRLSIIVSLYKLAPRKKVLFACRFSIDTFGRRSRIHHYTLCESLDSLSFIWSYMLILPLLKILKIYDMKSIII